jgi:hypothetical protein
VGSWGFVEAHLNTGWGFRAVERGRRGWSANLARFASGSSKILQAQETRGCGDDAIVQRGEKEVVGQGFGHLVGLQKM